MCNAFLLYIFEKNIKIKKSINKAFWFSDSIPSHVNFDWEKKKKWNKAGRFYQFVSAKKKKKNQQNRNQSLANW